MTKKVEYAGFKYVVDGDTVVPAEGQHKAAGKLRHLQAVREMVAAQSEPKPAKAPTKVQTGSDSLKG